MPGSSKRSVVVSYTIDIDPDEMARRGRIGAHITHSRYDPRELTAPAREAFLSKFEQEVDPEGVLSSEERRRRAEHARKAHMARISRLSALARRKPEPALLTSAQEADHVSA
jgi:hypothetical protein